MLTLCLNLNAQVKTKVFYSDIPKKYKSAFKEIDNIYTIKPTSDFIKLKNDKSDFKEIKFASQVKCNINFLKEATLEKQGDILEYSLSINAKEALNISLQFSKFKLPKQAILSIYTKNEFTDSISANENNEGNIWATRVYQGNKLSLILKVPSSAQEQVELIVGSVNFGYKNFGVLFDFGNIGVSANCQINANCPAGNGWNNEKNSIAMIVVDGQEQCTGSLIMNVCNTNTPYILTANHCLQAGNVPNWVFQFQTLSTDCATDFGWREDIQFNGCTLRANNATTDFALLQLNTTPLTNSGIFYSGWSRNTTGNTNTTILHHPQGDLMKISRDVNAPVSTFDVLTGIECWLLDLDLGIVEGGSSGAPYYNQNHQIIGQHLRRPQNIGNPRPPLCSMTQLLGGRFDQSWTGGGTNSTRLSNWLDPFGTNALTTNTTNISTLLQPSITPGVTGFTITKNNTGFDCSSVIIITNLPIYTTTIWTTTNGLLINGNPSPYTTTYGNSVTISSPNGADGIITAAVINGSCNITRSTIFCPCVPWTDPNPVMLNAPALIGEPLNASVDEHPDGAANYQWYVGNQLVDVTSSGYLWTTNWPCLGNPTGLTVIAVTSCGKSIPIGFSGEINCYSFSGRTSQSNNTVIKLFPNPANNIIFVSINKEIKQIKLSNNLNSISQISIFDNLGILKLTRKFANNTEQAEVDISKLNTGIYFIEVFDGKTKRRKQFIKK